MLTLAIVSAWLVLVGAVLLLPAYVGAARTFMWIAAFAAVELAALGSGVIVGAEHVPSDVGIVGAGAAGAAGLLLARAAQTGVRYGKGTYFDQFRILPEPSKPEPASAIDGCQPRFLRGEGGEEASSAHGRLQYVVRADVLGDTQLEVRARLTGPVWWGFGIKWIEMPVKVKIRVGCEPIEGQCIGFARLDGHGSSSKNQLVFTVILDSERIGSTLTCTLRTDMEYRARGAPSAAFGAGPITAGGQAFPTSDALSLGMGRFVWECGPPKTDRTANVGAGSHP
jgi:hypothetical protein